MPDSACLHVTGITSPRSWLWRLSWPCSSYLMDYVQCFIPYDPSPHEIIPHLKLSIFLEASNVPVEETSHMFVDVLEVGRLVQRSVLQLFILWTMAGVPKIFWKWCLYFLLDNTVVKGWDGSVLTLSLSLERKYCMWSYCEEDCTMCRNRADYRIYSLCTSSILHYVILNL